MFKLYQRSSHYPVIQGHFPNDLSPNPQSQAYKNHCDQSTRSKYRQELRGLIVVTFGSHSVAIIKQWFQSLVDIRCRLRRWYSSAISQQIQLACEISDSKYNNSFAFHLLHSLMNWCNRLNCSLRSPSPIQRWFNLLMKQRVIADYPPWYTGSTWVQPRHTRT